jgi:predicted ferric reductase/Ca2+-binding EF-hand superfamily protein
VIDLPDLQRALGVRSEYLARRVLKALDLNRDGVVRKDEFLTSVRALVSGSDQEKLRFAFRLHDQDEDGTLDRDEVLRMIDVSLAESDTAERASQTAEHLTNVLFRTSDANRDGRLDFTEFERAVSRRPYLLERMVRSEAIWIAPNEDLLLWLDERAGGARRAPSGAREHAWVPRAFLVAWIVANLALFCVVMARGLAAGDQPIALLGHALGVCASFDGALILVPMMRRLLTKVRATRLGRVVPVDEAIEAHKIVGHALFALAVTHAAAYVVAFGLGHAEGSFARIFFLHRVGLTGTLLLALFALMWLFSLSFIRRSRRFELFYFTHLLYVGWFALAIAHAPGVLMWVGVPLVGFLAEQLLRLWRRGPSTKVVASLALRSGVTSLELARPPGFEFSAGDYVFLRIPAVAQHEWHPFTISSAPERAHLGFHVRSLGNWSSALRRHVEQRAERGETRAFAAYVDGPYGSPSAHIFESRNVVLIGAGIGVTPFASVLESLLLRANDPSGRPSKLQHAHFFWLNRDQFSFEWFSDLLRDLEKIDARRMLDVHLCMTGGRANATALALEIARDVMHGAGRSDLFTGLRTHTHVGAPDWQKLLGGIVAQHQGERVEVFFCGPPGLADKLRPICGQLGMSFREERF